jgi:RNA polymerase-binding protein DksA
MAVKTKKTADTKTNKSRQNTKRRSVPKTAANGTKKKIPVKKSKSAVKTGTPAVTKSSSAKSGGTKLTATRVKAKQVTAGKTLKKTAAAAKGKLKAAHRAATPGKPSATTSTPTKGVKSTSELLKAIKARDTAASGNVAGTVKKRGKPKANSKRANKPKVDTVPIVPLVQQKLEVIESSPKSKAKKARAKFSKSTLAKFRKELLITRDHFMGQTHAMKYDALRRDDEMNPEEDGTDAFLRLQALNQMNDQQRVIAEIDDALNSIDKGTYGVCEMCGCLISRQRLTVRPFAKFCIQCKSELENGGRRKKHR